MNQSGARAVQKIYGIQLNQIRENSIHETKRKIIERDRIESARRRREVLEYNEAVSEETKNDLYHNDKIFAPSSTALRIIPIHNRITSPSPEYVQFKSSRL